MNDVLNLSIYIDCPPTDVYAFVSDPPHLPLWAAGLGSATMRKLIVSTFVSLDGIMQAPGAPEEDPIGGLR
jgi:uncharacterized protein YndB with AHSA1/START domain